MAYLQESRAIDKIGLISARSRRELRLSIVTGYGKLTFW
jgi:hypothetical protein